MDQHQKSDRLITQSLPVSPTHLPPAQLWFGPHTVLVQKTKQFLQELFCHNKGCANCICCKQIEMQQHHAILWLIPDKQYTLDQLDPIFSTISFALALEQKLFFIIQQADFLTAACANKLLKPMEEPPSGYHFILLAQRQEAILPTIRSRCTIKSFFDAGQKSDHELFTIFSTTTPYEPTAFLTRLNQLTINERESIELVDTLLRHWIQQSIQLQAKKQNADYEKSQQIINILHQALLTPPMPGSSKLFWKNLFLQIKQ